MNSEGLIHTVPGAARERRLIFIGDIHGCYDELVELLDRLAPRPEDVVVSVGDMVRKGPHSERCLDLWRERGYLAVQGNQEQRLLRYAHRPLAALLRLTRADRRLLRRRDLVAWMRTRPLVIDFPEERVAAVHGGFLPNMDVTARSVAEHRREIVKLRHVRERDGRWLAVPKGEEEPGDRFWSELWGGPRFVVYGHTPREGPRFDAKALGIDTGCVYGNKLTAAVWEGGRWEVVATGLVR